MKDPLDAAGEGYSASGGFNAFGADVSVGPVKSGQYYGVNIQVGGAIGMLMPFTISGYESVTKIKPITDKAKISKYKTELVGQLDNIRKSIYGDLERHVQNKTEQFNRQRDLVNDWKSRFGDGKNRYNMRFEE
ncbi:hypothetical protein PEPS_44620 (plasmid) [Persicobacter psychrovividus]|uniref:Uncharacterized protein n=2 Tax=Persicobacter psychrovividus TaxID=387638 RepID=A0ABM7VME6_9BACT|nr:hypothetical protein PEPS_44620 [Persicobacter psychrovividus]